MAAVREASLDEGKGTTGGKLGGAFVQCGNPKLVES